MGRVRFCYYEPRQNLGTSEEDNSEGSDKASMDENAATTGDEDDNGVSSDDCGTEAGDADKGNDKGAFDGNTEMGDAGDGEVVGEEEVMTT